MRTPLATGRRPLAILLWAALLLWGQTASLAHEHAEDVSGTPCAVCPLAKAQSAATGAVGHPPSPAFRPSVPEPDDEPICPDAARSIYHSRGPPLV